MLFWILSSLLFIILRLPSLFEPYWYGDEGIYLTLGHAVNSGLTLYSQIHDNKPPTLYYLAALGQTVFGFRLLLFVWMIPTIIVFYKLSQKFLSKKFSQISSLLFLVLTCIPFFEGNIANAEIFMLLPTLLAVFYFLYSHSRFKFLVSGLLLGFAFTIKVPVAVEFGFLFLYLLFFIPKNKIKNLFIFGFSFIIPILVLGIYYAFKGAFNQFLFSALLQNFGYLSSWSTGTHSGTATSGGIMTRVMLLAVSWVILYVLHRKKIISQTTLFLYGWFFATIFGVLLSTRPYPHYLIQLLPPFCILLFHTKIRYNLIPIAILLAIVVKYKFYFYPVLSYYQNFYLKNNQRSYFGSRVDDIYQISDYIRQNSEPDDRIFVWGDEPYIYPLSQRLPATKYTVAYHIVDFQGHDLTMDQLRIHFPKYIVTFPMSNREFAQLDEFISKYYYVVNSFNNAVIYQRR